MAALSPNTDRALYVHEDPWLGTLQLHHHDRAEVAALVAVRVVVAGEPAERSVRHLVIYFYSYQIFLCQTTHGSDVLHVGVVLSVAVQPGHVEPGAGPVQTVQREPGAGVDIV